MKRIISIAILMTAAAAMQSKGSCCKMQTQEKANTMAATKSCPIASAQVCPMAAAKSCPMTAQGCPIKAQGKCPMNTAGGKPCCVNAAQSCPLASGAMKCSMAKNAPVQNGIVIYEKGKFCGWPANYGMWSWGNEILVGYKYCYYQAKDRGHSYDREKPTREHMSRSLDGGKTWTFEEHPELNDGKEPVEFDRNIDFSHPDLGLRFRGETFRYSYDRGRTWSTLFKLGKFGQPRIMARTDYIVLSKDECLVFLTAAKQNNKEGRPFMAKMSQGGKNIEFVSWISDEPAGFSIMPATLRIDDNTLITAIRRKEVIDGNRWSFIEIYKSEDLGQTWKYLSRPGETGESNGNPADIEKLPDGRIAIVYGSRTPPRGMRFKLSSDNEKSWSKEGYLRTDARTWDIGYPQMKLTPSGKLVAAYYYTTEQNEDMHIAYSIIDPDAAIK